MNELYEVMKVIDVVILFYALVGVGFYEIVSVLMDGVMFLHDRIKKRKEKKKAKELKEDVTE